MWVPPQAGNPTLHPNVALFDVRMVPPARERSPFIWFTAL